MCQIHFEPSDEGYTCRVENRRKGDCLSAGVLDQARKQKLELIESPEGIGSVLPEQEESPISVVKIELSEIKNLKE